MVRGRDRGLYAVVIGYEPDRFIRIADGDKRKIDRPKKKNILHVRAMPYIDTDMAEAIGGGRKVTNANVRYALRRFLESRPQPDEVREKEEGVERGER